MYIVIYTLLCLKIIFNYITFNYIKIIFLLLTIIKIILIDHWPYIYLICIATDQDEI